MKIDAEHKLPCDFEVGRIRYRKGVKLETVRAAAQRWYNYATILPERRPDDGDPVNAGWNYCLDEMSRAGRIKG